jgi:hypothetical protein
MIDSWLKLGKLIPLARRLWLSSLILSCLINPTSLRFSMRGNLYARQMDLPFKSIIRGIRATVNGVFIFFSLFRKILIFYCFEKSSNIAKIFLDNGKKNLRVNLHVVMNNNISKLGHFL